MTVDLEAIALPAADMVDALVRQMRECFGLTLFGIDGAHINLHACHIHHHIQ